MTSKEIIKRNIGLSFDFLRQIVMNPELLAQIPKGSKIDFIEKDFSKIERHTTSRDKTGKISRTKFIRVSSHLEILAD